VVELKKKVSCKVEPVVPVNGYEPVVSVNGYEPVVPVNGYEPVVAALCVNVHESGLIPPVNVALPNVVLCEPVDVVLPNVVALVVVPVASPKNIAASIVLVHFARRCLRAFKVAVQTPVFQKKRIKKRKNKKLKRPVVNTVLEPVPSSMLHSRVFNPWGTDNRVCGLKLADVILAHHRVTPTSFFDKVVWSKATYWKSALSVLVKRSLIRQMTEDARYKLVKLWTVVLPEFQKWFDLNMANRAILTTAMQKMRIEKHPLTEFRSGFRVINLSFSKDVYSANIGNWDHTIHAAGFLPNWSIHVSNLGTRGIFSIPIVIQFDFHQTGATTPVFIDLDRLPFSEHMAEWVAYRQSVLLRYNLVIRHAVLHRWVKPRLQAMRLIARFVKGCRSRLRTIFYLGNTMQRTWETEQFFDLVEESPFILGQFLE